VRVTHGSPDHSLVTGTQYYVVVNSLTNYICAF
jgi:hypothetical protein